MTTVKLSELLDGFQFARFDGPFESSAYVSLDDGTIYCVSEEMDLDEEVPDDLETSDRYIAIPHKREFDLGRSLALSFTAKALPDDYDTVAEYFHRRGAYSRFKGLLDARDITHQWYAFENAAIESALCQWCEEHGLQIIK